MSDAADHGPVQSCGHSVYRVAKISGVGLVCLDCGEWEEVPELTAALTSMFRRKDRPMTDLADFLLARIAEDEAVARAAILTRYGQTGEWVTFDDKDHLSKTTVFAWNGGDHDRLGQACETEVSWIGRGARDHIARHDPARVLAECEAKRRMVERFADRIEVTTLGSAAKQYVPGAEDTGSLRLLALPYADHPDYREEWRP